MSRRSALIVANYAYDDERLRELTSPESDAAELSRVLGNPEIGGFEVRVVLNERHFVVRREIDAFFRERSRDQLLLLYFSGHGVKDEDGLLYLATVDTRREWLASTAVEAQFVHRAMEKSLSRRQILILDCCYSGAFGQSLRTKSDAGIATGEQFGGRGRVVLTASDAVQFAFEGPSTGEVETSVFTSALVEGIETGAADLNHDGFIDVDEWYSYAHQRIASQTANQRPSKWSLDVRGSLVVARNIHADPIKVGLPSSLVQAIESPFTGVREGAVVELEKLLGISDVGQARAARLALEQLADDDSRRVSAAARRALDGGASRQSDPTGSLEWSGHSELDFVPRSTGTTASIDSPQQPDSLHPAGAEAELPPVSVEAEEVALHTRGLPDPVPPNADRALNQSLPIEDREGTYSDGSDLLDQGVEPEIVDATARVNSAGVAKAIPIPDVIPTGDPEPETMHKGADAVAPKGLGVVQNSPPVMPAVESAISRGGRSGRRPGIWRKALLLLSVAAFLVALGLGAVVAAGLLDTRFGDDDEGNSGIGSTTGTNEEPEASTGVDADTGVSDAPIPIYRVAKEVLALEGAFAAGDAGFSIDESSSSITVYTLATNIEYLADYHEEALRDGGWEIHESRAQTEGNGFVVVASSGRQVATLVLGPTRLLTEAFDTITAEIPSSVSLRMNMIIAFEFTCTEESVDRCVDPFLETLSD